jgi:hypothetical protein
LKYRCQEWATPTLTHGTHPEKKKVEVRPVLGMMRPAEISQRPDTCERVATEVLIHSVDELHHRGVVEHGGAWWRPHRDPTRSVISLDHV